MPDLTARQRRLTDAAGRRDRRTDMFLSRMDEVARRRGYERGTLLTLSQIAELWGVQPKSAREYRSQSLREGPSGRAKFPREDVVLDNGTPLWRFRTIRDFRRPRQRGGKSG